MDSWQAQEELGVYKRSPKPPSQQDPGRDPLPRLATRAGRERLSPEKNSHGGQFGSWAAGSAPTPSPLRRARLTKTPPGAAAAGAGGGPGLPLPTQSIFHLAPPAPRPPTAPQPVAMAALLRELEGRGLSTGTHTKIIKKKSTFSHQVGSGSASWAGNTELQGAALTEQPAAARRPNFPLKTGSQEAEVNPEGTGLSRTNGISLQAHFIRC